jgi:hypothetical protein
MAAPRRAPAALSVAELVGTLSLAADLGLGQPMGHLTRAGLIAVRLAERMGLPAADRETAYYLALLDWVGCTADSHETTARFGDDIELRAGVYDVEIGSPPMHGYLLRKAGSDGTVLHRARGVGGLVRSTSRVAMSISSPRTATRRSLPQFVAQLRALLAEHPLHVPRRDVAGLPPGLGCQRRTDTGRLARRHAHRHDPVRRVRHVGARDAAAGDEQVVDVDGQEAAQRDVEGLPLRDPPQERAGALRVVDVQRVGALRDGVAEATGGEHVVPRELVLPAEPP